MIFNNKLIYSEFLYNFFIVLSLIIFFFSTTKVFGKSFNIDDIEISKPFEINFDKNEVIDNGFKEAFFELVSLIVNSSDKDKINQVKLNEIRRMVESFSIKEEKFVNEIYYVNLGVSFNKKKVFNFLEKKNIFPSVPVEKKILFIPIIIDESKKDLLIFSDNKIFNDWNNYIERYHLIKYILPSEDIEDLDILKNNFEIIEQYDFKEIINKYSLNDSIIALFFKNNKDLRVLSKITLKKNMVIKNQSFLNVDLKNDENIKDIIFELKTIYEDYWKNSNIINTSIKLALNIQVSNKDNKKISNFEKKLNETNLINDYFISRFDKDFVYYRIIYNGTPNNFLKSMDDVGYNFNTQNKFWILK